MAKSREKNTPDSSADGPVYRGQKKKYYEDLAEMRDAMRDQVRNLSSSALTSTRQPGEELADIGSDNFNQEMGLRLLTEEERKLLLIEEALERLDDRAFGRCIDCDKKIGAGRLAAIPYAKLCVECKEKREERGEYPLEEHRGGELVE